MVTLYKRKGDEFLILYAVLKNKSKIILTYNAKEEADRAGMSVDSFIREILRINPQFERVYLR